MKIYSSDSKYKRSYTFQMCRLLYKMFIIMSDINYDLQEKYIVGTGYTFSKNNKTSSNAETSQ